MHTSRAFVRFSRPHTIIATSIQVLAMFLLAVENVASLSAIQALLLALTASLALNIYIVGINQLTDIDIDRLNKPYLPLAAGDYSFRQGGGIVVVAGAIALLLAFVQPPYLTATIISGFLIGTLYSLPPLRFKERAVWAALSIAFVRGVVTTVGLYLTFRSALDYPLHIPPLIASAAIFFFGFGLVIALYKDIPDLEGDRHYTVRTFTVRLGPHRVFALGRWLLTFFYLFPIALLLSEFPAPTAVLFLLAHATVLSLFWFLSFRIDPTKPQQMTRFYMGLWTLFYVEYALLVAYHLLAK